MASEQMAATEADTLEEKDVRFEDMPTHLYPTVQQIEPHLPRIESFLAEITGVRTPTELSLLVAETLTRRKPPKLSTAPRVYYGKTLRDKIADKIIKPAIAFLRLGPRALPSPQSRSRSRSPSRSRCITTASETSVGCTSLDAMKPKTLRFVDIMRTISYNRTVKALPEGQRYGQFYRSRSLNPSLDLDTRSKSFSVAQAMSYIDEEADKEQVIQRAISYRPPPINGLGTDQAFVEEDELEYGETCKGFAMQDDNSREAAATPRDPVAPFSDETQSGRAPDADEHRMEEPLFTPVEIASITALLETPPDRREPSSIQFLANTLGKLNFFQLMPWQARLTLCRHAKCVEFKENQELILGPVEDIEKQLLGKDLVVVLSGFGCIEDRGGAAVSHTKPKLWWPGADFLLTEHQSTSDGGNGRSKIARIGTPSTWLVVSREAHQQSLQLDVPGGPLRAEQILKENKLFTASLSSDEIQTLSQLCRVETYPKDTTILRAWEPAPCIYIVESGECMVQSGILGLAKGKEEPSYAAHERGGRNASLQLMTLRRGECFGEATAIKGQRLWTSLKTKSACKLISVTMDAFESALAKTSPATIAAAFEMIVESSKNLLIKAISLQLKMVLQRELDPMDLTKRMQQIISDATTKGMTQKQSVPGLEQARDVFVPTDSSYLGKSCEQLSDRKRLVEEKEEVMHLDGSKVSAAKLEAVGEIGRNSELPAVTVSAPLPNHPVPPPLTDDARKWKQMSEAFKIPAEEVETMRSTEGYGSEAPSTSAIAVILHTKENAEENATAQEHNSRPTHTSALQYMDHTISQSKAQEDALAHRKNMATGGFLEPDPDAQGIEDSEYLVNGRHTWVRHTYHTPGVHPQQQQQHNTKPADTKDNDDQDVWYVAFKPPKGKSTLGNVKEKKEVQEDKPHETSNNLSKREMGSTLRHVPNSFHPVERQPIFPEERKLPNEQWTVPKFNSEEGFPDGLYDENNHILYFG